MTYHVDGEPITDFEEPADDAPRTALGWLSADHGYERGPCPPAVVAVLEQAAQTPVARTRSWFQCPLCPVVGLRPTTYQAADGTELLLGNATLEVRAEEIWRAPSLVLHYIDQHDYLPPARFVSQVGAG